LPKAKKVFNNDFSLPTQQPVVRLLEQAPSFNHYTRGPFVARGGNASTTLAYWFRSYKAFFCVIKAVQIEIECLSMAGLFRWPIFNDESMRLPAVESTTWIGSFLSCK